MPRLADDTRNAILDAAEEIFLERGFGGASIDEILGRTSVTKGAFFHHFRSKMDLARELIGRYARKDADLMADFVDRAEHLSRDPLQQVQIVLGLYEEAMEGGHPGCLFASYAYQSGLFDEGTNGVIRDVFVHWRDVFAAKLTEAMKQREPRLPVTPGDLADGALTVMEGAFVLSLSLGDPQLISRQIRQYRNYIDLLFGLA